ncbi:MAG: hypothetical protein AAGH79_00335 [Bacteroidota bacterium]
MEIIRLFSQEEQEKLQLFLRASYFYQGKEATEILRLYDYILQQAPHFLAESLEKETVFSVLYPNDTFQKGRIEKRMSALLKRIEQYIIQLELEKQGATDYGGLLLARFFRSRSQDKRFEQQRKKLLRNWSGGPVRSEADWYLQYLLAKEEVLFASAKNQRSGNLGLPELFFELDRYYILTRLEYTVLQLAQNIHVSLDMEDELKHFESWLASLEGSKILQEPVVQIYYQAFRLLRQHGEESRVLFDLLRTSLQDYQHLLPIDQQKVLQSLLRIHASARCNQANSQFLRPAFELYVEHLEAGYILYDQKLPPSTYRNLVTLGLRNGEYAWVDAFLEKRWPVTSGAESSEEAYTFNRANLLFHQGDYEASLDLLMPKYEDLYYQLAARRLEIKIYYELNSPILDARMEAFKVYIFRLAKQGLPQKPKDGNNHFLDSLRQICHPKTLNNPERVERLQARLAEKRMVAERNWLEEKLQELAF